MMSAKLPDLPTAPGQVGTWPRRRDAPAAPGLPLWHSIGRHNEGLRRQDLPSHQRRAVRWMAAFDYAIQRTVLPCIPSAALVT
jgi:hypothetical protein